MMRAWGRACLLPLVPAMRIIAPMLAARPMQMTSTSHLRTLMVSMSMKPAETEPPGELSISVMSSLLFSDSSWSRAMHACAHSSSVISPLMTRTLESWLSLSVLLFSIDTSFALEGQFIVIIDSSDPVQEFLGFPDGIRIPESLVRKCPKESVGLLI